MDEFKKFLRAMPGTALYETLCRLFFLARSKVGEALQMGVEILDEATIRSVWETLGLGDGEEDICQYRGFRTRAYGLEIDALVRYWTTGEDYVGVVFNVRDGKESIVQTARYDQPEIYMLA